METVCLRSYQSILTAFRPLQPRSSPQAELLDLSMHIRMIGEIFWSTVRSSAYSEQNHHCLHGIVAKDDLARQWSFSP
jgi:hypothetical protein